MESGQADGGLDAHMTSSSWPPEAYRDGLHSAAPERDLGSDKECRGGTAHTAEGQRCRQTDGSTRIKHSHT